MIQKLFEPLIEAILWISLVIALVVGWEANGGLVGSLFALLIWLFMAILFIGLALIIIEIRNIVKKIEDRLSQRETEN